MLWLIVGFLIWMQIWLVRGFRLVHYLKVRKLKMFFSLIREIMIDVLLIAASYKILGQTNFALMMGLGINIITTLLLRQMLKLAKRQSLKEEF